MFYLDHAATSFPKAPGVLDAVRDWYERLGVDAARGTSPAHREVAAAVAELRSRLGRHHGTPSERVILLPGATTAANLFLKGCARPGLRVWTTALEHNAVVRPLVGLRIRSGIELEVLAPGEQGVVTPEAFTEALATRPPPELFVLNHASNVTGAVQDAARLLSLAKEAGALTLLDGAQTSGRLPLAELPFDAVIVPAHKAWLGPPGAGALCLRGNAPLPLPLVEGGTGSARALDRMPAEPPAGLEAGTPNTPGLLGWLAAVRWVEETGPERLLARELEAFGALWDGLAEAEEEGLCRRLGPAPGGARTAVLSLALADLDPVETAMALEASGLVCRAGFHCAPYIHAHLGTEAQGTLRLSPGPELGPERAAEAAALVHRTLRLLRA